MLSANKWNEIIFRQYCDTDRIVYVCVCDMFMCDVLLTAMCNNSISVTMSAEQFIQEMSSP